MNIFNSAKVQCTRVCLIFNRNSSDRSAIYQSALYAKLLHASAKLIIKRVND